MTTDKLWKIAQGTAAIYCHRCSMGHAVHMSDVGVWNHGTDDMGGGVFAPPEPCDAAAAYELVVRLECKECFGTGWINAHPTGEEMCPDRCHACDGEGIVDITKQEAK